MISHCIDDWPQVVSNGCSAFVSINTGHFNSETFWNHDISLQLFIPDCLIMWNFVCCTLYLLSIQAQQPAERCSYLRGPNASRHHAMHQKGRGGTGFWHQGRKSQHIIDPLSPVFVRSLDLRYEHSDDLTGSPLFTMVSRSLRMNLQIGFWRL